MAVRIIHDNAGYIRNRDYTNKPCPTIRVGDIRSYQVVTDGRPEVETRKENKPPYAVPLMSDIAALAPNGLTVVSLFSGCGGSCLGFRMAGYRIAYANEFIPAARDSYRANNPGTPLDERDVRTVTGASIREIAKLGTADIDVLEGSPPCASFSTAGKREAGWGRVKQYSDTKQRTDDLFFEYARILTELQPRAFVAENVSGLVKGTAKGYFLDILDALKRAGYRVSCRALDAQWLGVPQMRRRVIFVGVRNDLGIDPAFPKPLPYRYSVRDALPWIVRHEFMGPGHTNRFASAEAPAYTVSQMGNFSKKLSDYTLVEAVAAVNTKKGTRSVNQPAPTVQTHGNRRTQSELTLVEAETDISRYAIGAEWDKVQPGGQSDKYFQLQKPHPDKPCGTLTLGNCTLGVASIVHPTEKRRFSIAELKRICAFPDDFILTGTYAQQWERLGRAVPPLMMRAVAEVLRDSVLCQKPTQ